MTHHALDLDAYFDRIGHSGPRTTTLATLRAIVARHTQAIPFENLDPLLGRPVRLDAASLEAKLVRGGRGGYCFEQNLLLQHVLQGLGFGVSMHGARMLMNGDGPAARSHVLLVVEAEGARYLADVGLGGLTLTAPLRLETDVEQATPHEPFRLVAPDESSSTRGAAAARFVVQAWIREEWWSLYRFELHEALLPDVEIFNWYLSNHPESRFVTGLSAARAEQGRRFTLRNRELAVHVLGGGTERRAIHTADELRRTLEHVFRIVLPDVPELDAALERVIAADGEGAPRGVRWEDAA